MRGSIIVILMGLMVWTLSGCDTISEAPSENMDISKAREVWNRTRNFPNAQDIAILIPRDEKARIRALDQNSLGERLLPEDWIQTIGDAFLDTPVEDAFTEESWYGDWQLSSVRVAPCSPLVKTPGGGTDVWCWPEIRLSWQPTMYNIRVSWSSSYHLAYSDDRAVHVLYDILPVNEQRAARRLISQARSGNFPDAKQFLSLRNRAITQMLNRLVRLRGLSNRVEGGLRYRTELMTEPAAANEFLSRFLSTFDDVLLADHVHTVAAFSLPEGRQPAITNAWSFVAFKGINGQLEQKAIEIVDPNTGMVVGRLDGDETVAMASADHRLEDQIELEGNDSSLEELILLDTDDRFEKGERVNDPEQTLIPNTSCATCHSMNPLAFDFHNLSYFEQEEITVAPRVEADVRSELSWIREWIDEP